MRHNNMQVAKVLLPMPMLFPLDYLVPPDLNLQLGDLVIVSFRNKDLTGIIFAISIPSCDINKLKHIKSKAPLDLSINHEMLKMISWVCDYYLASLGSVAKLVLPVDISENPIKIQKQNIPARLNIPDLSAEQITAFNKTIESDKPVIIKGVTGSGKTEIYFHLIKQYLDQGKQILLMLPEITLSKQIISRFVTRFNFEPIIWNSEVTKAQKKMILRAILQCEVRMVIGTRSSLFLPYPNLGLIIIDEEHDTSYKQNENTPYHARDMAVLRHHIAQNKLKLVLCSATPSIETLHNAEIGKYELVEVTSRYKDATFPEIRIIDMGSEKMEKGSYISPSLLSAIMAHLERKKQILLFLNRRGYAPLLLCKLCGYRFVCKSCSAWLVVHKFRKKLECHHCGYVAKLHSNCPECKSEDSLIHCGPGIEKIEEEVRSIFPNHITEIMSRDSNKTQNVQELLKRMEESKIDILIGTQIISKGYNFPNLTLVGVIDADLGSTNLLDLRSTERTYQLLHQIGGRAGRSNKNGFVFFQTYYPNNLIFKYMQNREDGKFLQYELQTRRELNMPPFTKMVSIVISGKNQDSTLNIARDILRKAPRAEVRILGPTPAQMQKLASKYRYQMLIIVDKKFNIQKYLTDWFTLLKIPSTYHVKIDIDPQNFS